MRLPDHAPSKAEADAEAAQAELEQLFLDYCQLYGLDPDEQESAREYERFYKAEWEATHEDEYPVEI